jgi:hypothetical protein
MRLDAAASRAASASEGTSIEASAGAVGLGWDVTAIGRLDVTHRRGDRSAFLSGEVSSGRAGPTAWEILTGMRWRW